MQKKRETTYEKDGGMAPGGITRKTAGLNTSGLGNRSMMGVGGGPKKKEKKN